MTTQATMLGQFEESESLERLKAQRQENLANALLRFDWHPGTAEHRIAMMFFHLSKDNQQPILWTNTQIAADGFVASDNNALTVNSISRAIGNLRRVGIVDQQSAKSLGIPTYGRTNVQARSINHGRVHQLANELASESANESISQTRFVSQTDPTMPMAIEGNTHPDAVLTSAPTSVLTSASSSAPARALTSAPTSALTSTPDSYSAFNTNLPITKTTTNEAEAGADSEIDLVVGMLEDAGLFPSTARRLAPMVDAETCRQILIEFKHNRSLFTGSGAIVGRIQEGLWPAEGVRSYQAIQDAQAAKERRKAEQAAAQRLARQQAEESQSRQAQQESKFGPMLDGMSAADRTQLARDCLPDLLFETYQRGNIVAVRDFLLDELEARSATRELATSESAISAPEEQHA